MDWRNYLFSFKGRLNRAKQWLFLGLFLVTTLIYEAFVTKYLQISWKQFGQIFSTSDYSSPTGRQALMLMVPFWLITAIPVLATGVKRLHDRNRSGWWVILLVYVPWVLGLFQLDELWSISGLRLSKDLTEIIQDIFVYGLDAWAFVELNCLRGTVGQNRFGPDPLGTPVEQVFE